MTNNLLIFLTFILLAGCAVPDDTDPAGDTESDERQSSLQWADIVMWDGKEYYFDEYKTNDITEEDISEEIGEITFSVVHTNEENNPSYQLKNREATLIKKGSTVYSIDSANDEDYIYAEHKVYRAVE